MTSASSITDSLKVIIVAGGGSRRMGDGHKGNIPINGIPMIGHVINIIKKQHPDIAINTNSDADAFIHYGYPIFADHFDKPLGPLAGVYSAFKTYDCDYILTLPCDTPQLPSDLLPRMITALIASRADVCSVSDGHKLHPVILLSHRSVMNSIEESLLSGERRVHQWFKKQHHAIADFSDQHDAFMNINTPQEFAAIKAIIS